MSYNYLLIHIYYGCLFWELDIKIIINDSLYSENKEHDGIIYLGILPDLMAVGIYKSKPDYFFES